MDNICDMPDPVTVELLEWIQQSIERLVGSVDGLTDDQVRVPVAASGWTIAGLLVHVLDSTTFWLHNVVAGNPMDFDDDDAWNNDPSVPLARLTERMRVEVQQRCSAVSRVASTAAPNWWPDGAWGGYRQHTVRGVLIHLLNDNAAHTGHLDLARESIDGAVWDYRLGRVVVR